MQSLRPDRFCSLRLFSPWLLGLLLVWPFVSTAQDNDKAGEEAPPPTTFQIYLWEKYTPPGKDLYSAPPTEYTAPSFHYLDNQGVSHPAGAVDRRFSPEHEIYGDRILFVNESPPNAEGVVTRTPIAEAQLNPGQERVLLLMFPRKNSPTEQYDVLIISTSSKDIPPGSLLVMNMSGKDLATMVGKHQFTLSNGASQLVSVQDTSTTSLPLMVGALDEEGKYVRRHRKNLVVDPSASGVVLLYRSGERFRSLVLENRD